MANARKKIVSGRPYRAVDLGIEEHSEVVWGVFVGGCIAGHTATWRLFYETYAHAHNSSADEWRGWICILEPKHVLTKAGNPSRTLLHEVAHLLVPDQGHTAKWRKVVTELGAKSEATRELPRLPSTNTIKKKDRESLRLAARRLR